MARPRQCWAFSTSPRSSSRLAHISSAQWWSGLTSRSRWQNLIYTGCHNTAPCSDIKIVKFCDISHQGDPTFVELPCRPCVEVTIHLTRLDFFLKSIFSSFFLFLLHLIVLKCFSFLEKSLSRSLVGFKTEARTVGHNITYMCVLMDSFDVIGYEFLGRRWMIRWVTFKDFLSWAFVTFSVDFRNH